MFTPLKNITHHLKISYERVTGTFEFSVLKKCISCKCSMESNTESSNHASFHLKHEHILRRS